MSHLSFFMMVKCETCGNSSWKCTKFWPKIYGTGKKDNFSKNTINFFSCQILLFFSSKDDYLYDYILCFAFCFVVSCRLSCIYFFNIIIKMSDGISCNIEWFNVTTQQQEHHHFNNIIIIIIYVSLVFLRVWCLAMTLVRRRNEARAKSFIFHSNFYYFHVVDWACVRLIGKT